ncbi:MAG: indole-3-glycerol phosphate synthase TrpC [Spirochaetia bacterium]|nr:indole-3-glycerol phosphate synthase TrpC [Spirochaetia bacterium]
MEPVANAAGLLEKIVETKKREVEAIPELELVHDSSPGSKFKNALKRSGQDPVKIIAECKKASPSMGLLKADYEPEFIAKEYARLGASAVSVLTDRDYFQGDLSHLPAAKNSGIPVLRKDFIISPSQIFESKSAGADAILLIVRILDDFQLRDFLEIARSVNMDILVEIHNEAEMERALKADADIIGINHRDLDTLQMNLALTEKLAPIIRREKKDSVIVAESGVESREGRIRVDAFADAILIGSALMKSENIETAWKKIFY